MKEVTYSNAIFNSTWAYFAVFTFALTAIALFMPATAMAQTTHTVCESDCDETSIQDAVDAAASGDTIEVQSGAYDGTTIDKEVAVIGEGDPEIQTQMELAADDASLQGVTFSDTYDDAVLTLSGNSNSVDNIVMDVGTKHGASIDIKGDNATIENSEFTRSGDEGYAFIEAFKGPNSPNATGAPSGVTIEGNTLTGGDIGVQIEDGGSVTIEDNDITPASSDDDAIWVTGVAYDPVPESATVTVKNNGALVAVEPREGGHYAYYTTIQAAIDDADEGGAIEVAEGTYDEVIRINTEGLTVTAPNDATIEPGSSTVNGAGRARVVDTNGYNNVTFSGFDVVGPGKDNQDIWVGITVTGDGNKVSNNNVSKVWTGIQTSGGSASNATIGGAEGEGNTVSDVKVGISIQSQGASVTGNTLAGTAEGMGVGSANGTSTSDVSIQNNTFSPSGDNINFWHGTNGGVDVNTIIENNSFDKLAVVDSEVVGDANKNEISKTLYTSIQDAVDAVASGGDTVGVASGIYNESVTINTASTTLESTAGADATTISPDTDSNNRGVSIKASDVTVRGFTVTSGLSEPTEFYGIRLEPTGSVSNILIENNTVEDIEATSRPAGISLDMKDNSTNGTDEVATDVTVRNNIVRNITSIKSSQDTGFAKGINPNERFHNLTIENNIIKNIGGEHSAGANGIDFSSDTGADSNVGPKNFTIKGNEIDGITVGEEASDPWLDDNALYFHAYGDLGEEHIVTENNFKDGRVLYNTEGVSEPDTLNAEHNYWGAASGPSGEGNGDGVAVSKNVDYRPWLLEEDGTHYDETVTLTSAGEWSLVSAPQTLANRPTVEGDDGVGATLLGSYANQNEVFTNPPTANDKPINAFFAKISDSKKGGVGFTYADVDPSTVSKELATGWNLVGVGAKNTPTNAFSTIKKDSSADGTGVTTLFAPKSYNAQKDLGNIWSGPGDENIDISNWNDENDLGIFDGYWIYTNAPKTYSLVQ